LNCKSEHVLKETLTEYPFKYWNHCSDQTAKHGVAVLSKYEPLSVSYTFGPSWIENKFSGRFVQLEFSSYYLISVYVPNSGTRLNALEERIKEWDVEMYRHLNELKQHKDIIYTGDLNVVHLEKDTFNFKQQRNKLAGVFDVERENFQNLLDSGFINVYRELHPRKVEYTYFTYLFDARTTNTGMTLDYFLVTPNMFEFVQTMRVLKDVTGSDHVPIELVFDLPTDTAKNMKDIINSELSILAKKEAMEGNSFKARAYQKVIQQVKKLDSVTSMADFDGMPGVGKKIQAKLEEIFTTGSLASAQEARGLQSTLNIYDKLVKVYGIGPGKAKELIETDGITSLDHLRQQPELLNEQQRIGLKYYDDLIQRIPRSEMDKHNKYLTRVLGKLGVEFQITGSYRRGLNESGDIDILVKSSEDSNSVLDEIIKTLIKSTYMIEALALGQKKFMGISHLPGGIPRRIDILVTTPEEYPSALLYFTWGQQMNIELRKKAQKKGLKLNEKGLWDANGNRINLGNEQDIFNYLE
jgi:exodeoxyribonuclease III